MKNKKEKCVDMVEEGIRRLEDKEKRKAEIEEENQKKEKVKKKTIWRGIQKKCKENTI